MKLGIMQTYFFPYLGYFDLIQRTDAWVVFDTAQYIRHGWVNRNRILHPKRDWQYIVVPLQKHARETPICEIRIARGTDWQRRIVGQLDHYKKRAPYFDDTLELVHRCLDIDSDLLNDLNISCLVETCRYLGIPFAYEKFSENNMPIGPVATPGEWALRICQARGADEYWNPPGGAALFDPRQYQAAGIRLCIQSFCPMPYDTPGYEFQPGLSILDTLMWCRPDEVRAYLQESAARAPHAPEVSAPLHG